MSFDRELQRCNRMKAGGVKIMALASISLTGEPAARVEIRRGMIVFDKEGREAGRVAGVVVSRQKEQALCLLISHLPEEVGYQSLPLGWVARVRAEEIILDVPVERVRVLPAWHAA